MKSKIKQTFKLILFILLTNTYFLKSHDSFNGGCENHCKKSEKPLIMNKELNNIINKDQSKDNNSCLSKSLCRG